MKRAKCTIITAIFIIVLYNMSYANDEDALQEIMSLGYSYEYLETQAKCLKNHEKLMNTFEKDSNGKIIYPEWFAGTFMDHEKGQLVVFKRQVKCVKYMFCF